MRSVVRILFSVAAIALLAGACSSDTEPEIARSGDTVPEPPTTTTPDATVVDVIVATDGTASLVSAVQVAGLAEVLSGDGPFTVFAPTDQAFAAAAEELGITVDDLLADPEGLSEILTYHVVEGEFLAEDVVELDGESVTTVNGADVTIAVDGESVLVNQATVVEADLVGSNGVVHLIDAVLLPPDDADIAADTPAPATTTTAAP